MPLSRYHPKPPKEDPITQAVLASIPRQTFVRRDAIDDAQRRGCEACYERLLLDRGLCPKCDSKDYK